MVTLIFIGFIVILVVGLILVPIEKEKEEKRKRTRLSDFNSSISICDSKFQTTTQIIPPCGGKFMAAIDDIHGSIFIKVQENQLFSNTVGTYYIKYNSIMRVELVENGQKTYSKSALRTIGGAIVGGVALGGAGAIVGGLSGGSKECTYIESIIVKIYVRDINNPAIAIEFYNKYLNSSFELYHLREAAIKLVDTLNVIIDKVDRGEYIPRVENNTIKQPKLAAPLTPYQIFQAENNTINEPISDIINSPTLHIDNDSDCNNMENEALGYVLSGDSRKALEILAASGMDNDTINKKLNFFEKLKNE